MKHQLPECIPVWRDLTLTLSGQAITLTTPADPDQLLEDPATLADFEQTQYVPYWAYLWPAARQMAQLFERCNTLPAQSLLELGCGSGLVGLAALATELETTFSDCRHEALQLACYNAEQNGFTNYSSLLLDWFDPPNDFTHPWIVASDVLYEARFHQPLIEACESLLATNGELWLGDPGRALVFDFLRLAQQRGWEPIIYNQMLEQQSLPAIGQFQLLVFRDLPKRKPYLE